MKKINVWLVGAGPGNLNLLTLRGYEVIKNSDVVIYDRLVGDGVLSIIPEQALKINVGKSANSHPVNQREIENLIITHAKNNKRVVRLKGGDPFLFGRGGEEVEALIKNNIAFEIVPGVSSAVAVPELAGIPVTHRDFNSGVSIFTAHNKNNLIPDFDERSLIFLMGASRIKDIAEKLLNSNFDGSTPCAIIQNGAMAMQKIIRADLKKFAHENFNIQPPAVIVIGKIAGLNLIHYGRLHGKRILLTRPEGRADELSRLLRDEGAEIIHLPAIKFETLHGALNNFDLGCYDFIAFTSVTGVRAFFELLRETERDIREILNAKIAAIGSATANELKNFGLRVDIMPDIYDGKHLAEKLNGRVLLLRALDVSSEIDEILTARSISFNTVHVYKTSYVKFDVPDFIDAIIFTSSSTVKSFAMNTNGYRDIQVICIGEKTALQARLSGFKNVVISKRADITSIYEAVLNIFEV